MNDWPSLHEDKKKAIRALDWQPGSPDNERPAEQYRVPYANNGSGENFPFMHRQMIKMVRDMYQEAGLEPIARWKMIPPPGTVSVEPDYTAPQVKLPPPGNPDGFAVMPNWAEPGQEDDCRRQRALKSDTYYWSHMFPASQEFQDSGYLASLTPAAMGALIEWTIHNVMHMRWTSEPQDPITGEKIPSGRHALDLDLKWDNLKYDSFFEPYSSLVNPVFWRLHGCIDDRMEDWFAAHEATHPGEIQRREYGGVSWFEQGKWVLLDSPWSKPAEGLNIEILEVVKYFSPDSPGSRVQAVDARKTNLRGGPRVQWFGRLR